MGKGKNAGYQHFLLFQQCFLKPSLRVVKSGSCVVKGKGKKIVEPFPKRQISDSSKLKEFADDNFKFDENNTKFSKWVENSGKRGNGLLQAISPFPTVFSKDLNCKHVKTRACLVMG